jgi:hypothetical protein
VYYMKETDNSTLNSENKKRCLCAEFAHYSKKLLGHIV